MTTTTTRTMLPALAAAVLLGAAVTPAQAKIVCWTNSEGVRECGNAVPPEYAQQSVERKSSMGVTVEKTERAKTREELEKERLEQERLARQKEEQERLAAEQKRYDTVLLQTFTTEEDLKLARDGKMAAIDSRIKHSEQLVARLKETRSELQGEAADLERGGKKVPEELRMKIADVQAQIDKTRTEIGQRQQERVAVQEKFESDLARYRELKGG